MQRMKTWKYGLSIAALAIMAVSCSEATNNPVAPEPTGGSPKFGVSTPPNGPGQCMVDDVQSYSRGGPTNCTANDISIAIATVGSINGQAYTGQAVECNEGDTIFVDMTAELRATSASERHDVGIWIATDGGDARTGDCNHYNLIPGTTGTTNTDLDQCAGMTAPDNKTDAVTQIPLGVIPVVCSDANNDGFVEVGACVAWGIPGGDQVCADDADGNGTAGQPTDFRAATIPDNAAKCNCDPFQLPITVAQVATIEVRKVCSPTTDAGTFDLNIDGTTYKNNATCAGGSASTTGPIEVGAGTNQNPGATHSTTENDFTTANYSSSYVCTQNGHALSSGTGTSSGTFTAYPDSAYVCTYTNVRNAGLTIVKDAVPNSAQDFAFTGSGTGLSNFSLDDDADGTLQSSQSFNNLAPGGTRTVTEGSVSGWQITNIACTGATNSTVAYLGGGGGNAYGAGDNQVSVVLAAGEAVSCTFTNTQEGSITIVKDTQNPATDATDFGFTATGTGTTSPFSLDDDADGTLQSSITFSGLLPGVRTFTEDANSNWVLTGLSCTGAATYSTNTSTRVASVTLAAGENVTCTFVNQRKAQLIVDKIVTGGSLVAFDFTRNPGGASFSLTDAATPNSSGYTLAPGTYRVCEVNVPAGWGDPSATIDNVPATLINPDDPQLLGNFCVDVTVAYGDSKTVAFTNQLLPSTGGTRTIGYWKNWSSCSKSNGSQYDKAIDKGFPTLDQFLVGGSSIYPIGDITTLSCLQAVALLSKSAIDGTKRAGDPVYNMVAQLLGVKLNLANGTFACPALEPAMTDAQAFLDAINFTGLGSYSGKNPTLVLTSTQISNLNTWAGVFGSYNEGTLGGTCPTHV